MGYHRAGFDVVGVDNQPQPNYPFEFVQANVFDLMLDLDTFDLVHASPPCQFYSMATGLKSNHPDLVKGVRQLLRGRDYVIENVPQAPLRQDLMLCGSMFDLQIRRHRIFELEGLFVWGPPTCTHDWDEGRPWSVVGNAGGDKPWDERSQASTDHSFKYKNVKHAQELMGMPWAKRSKEIVEAIPPVYTEFIGKEYLSTH